MPASSHLHALSTSQTEPVNISGELGSNNSLLVASRPELSVFTRYNRDVAEDNTIESQLEESIENRLSDELDMSGELEQQGIFSSGPEIQPEVTQDNSNRIATIVGTSNTSGDSSVKWLIRGYSWDEIKNVTLPDVPKERTSWTQEEQLVLDQIHKFYSVRVSNKGEKKTLSIRKLRDQYLYLARFRKLEDSTRVLYNRSDSMLRDRVALLKKNSLWT
jgi:hypothetical protein